MQSLRATTVSRSGGRVILLISAFLLLGWMGADVAGAASLSCLGCHSQEGMEMTLEDGSVMGITVASSELESSVHSMLECSNCHGGFSDEEHPFPSFKNARAVAARWVRGCQQCHTFQEGIHATMLQQNKNLLCTDCHGAHSVTQVNGQNNCLGCHQKSLSLVFGDGSSMGIQIRGEVIAHSVHGSLRCVDCHFGFSGSEHPQRSFFNARGMTISHADSCRRCHFDKYTRSLEGIHYAQLSKGNQNAPVCVDCHGAHSVQSGVRDKISSAARCRQCHSEIFDTYAKSVHGTVLLKGLKAASTGPAESNGSHLPNDIQAAITDYSQDVPVCADCHRAHDVLDPHAADFRNRTPEMCGNCHGDKELMTRHGLSTSVVDSYLEDFHGVTLSFYKEQGYSVRRIAVCTDCHGIHDIARTDGPDSLMVKENLLQRCRNCHPDAQANFPDSWLSHYEPNMQHASLVWLVNLIYDIFIPFMIVGLVLQILLHIWRYAVNR